jgi:hypothetical protein
MIRSYILIIIVTILMGGAVAYGLMGSGSPLDARGKKFDDQRVSDLSSISNSVESYYRSKNMLPTALADLTGDYYSKNILLDPESSIPYRYEKINDTSYKLCATFATSSDKKNNRGAYYYVNDFEHPKGEHCFDINVKGEVLNPTLRPSSTPLSSNRAVTNDDELVKRSRDAARLSDLASLQNAINVAVQESTNSGVLVLCNLSKKYPCKGDSSVDSRLADGQGWIKINLQQQRSVSVPVLPVDPVNQLANHYVYCADKDNWEINAFLESEQYKNKMANDGGDNPFLYEVGSNLTLVGSGNGCIYK